MKSFSGSERRILVFANAAHFLAHTCILVFPSIASPLSAELGLPFEDVLKISFLMYLLYGLGSLPMGYLSDKIQYRTSLSIYLLGIGVSGALVFLTQSRQQLVLTLAVFGLFLSMYHPIGLGIVSKFVNNRGMALGINGMYGSIGIAAAPFLAGFITYFFGWRYVYLVLGIVAILFGLTLIILKIEMIPEGDKVEKKKTNETANEKTTTVRLLYFLILCGSFALAGFVYRGQTLVLPTYLEQKAQFLYRLLQSLSFLRLEGTKTLSATILTSLVYVISIVGQLIGGKVADRFDLRYSYFLFFACALPFVVAMYFLNEVPLFIASSIFIMFTIGMQPIENSLLAKFTPSKWRGTAFGIKFILTFGVSSVVIYPIGFFQATYSLATVFLLFSLLLGILVINNGVLIFVTRGMRVKN